MNQKYETKISKFISLVLRHNPDIIKIKLDANGWAITDELIQGLNNHGYKVTVDDLKEIVYNDAKGRYSFSNDNTKIRANQGHSIKVDVELAEYKPPTYLYHGTGVKSLCEIKEHGLRPMGRLYVHLSKDYNTAIDVGKRHGTPIVLKIKSAEMHSKGFVFYQSENNVWLTNSVPVEYIEFPDSSIGNNIRGDAVI